MLKFSWNVDSCMCLVSYASWTPWLTQPFVAQGLRYWQICNGIFASTAFRARAFQAVASQATSCCNCNSRLFKVWLPFLSFNISSWVEFLLGLLHVKLDCCVQTCLDSHGKIRYSNPLSKCSFEKQHSWQFRIGWITQKHTIISSWRAAARSAQAAKRSSSPPSSEGRPVTVSWCLAWIAHALG